MKITNIDIHRPMIDIGEGWEPDPNWVFTDSDGNKHRWKKVNKHWELPTLIIKEQEIESADVCEHCGHDIDGAITEEHYEAPTGERVHPGHRRTGRKMIPGKLEWGGSFESTEVPDMKKSYRLEDCEFAEYLPEFGGEFFVERYDDMIGPGKYRGAFVGIGKIAEVSK